jgi:hypothetical protein
VERGHGVAGSTNRIITDSGSGPISSIDDIGFFSPCTAICADANALDAPAACTKDSSIDFRANDDLRGD